MKIVAYTRVSTDRQGRSGLGLDAQRAAIAAFAAEGHQIVADYTEVESGRDNGRPELAKALHRAKVTGATLVIAKLDRLSRNAAFLMNLQESGVRFIAADMATATELTVGIMALVAQEEAKAISRRTKDALTAAKARGQRLGNPNGADALRRAGKGNAASVAAIKHNADAHAAVLRDIVLDLRRRGLTLAAMADRLTADGIKTARGGQWTATAVRNVLLRLAEPAT